MTHTVILWPTWQACSKIKSLTLGRIASFRIVLLWYDFLLCIFRPPRLIVKCENCINSFIENELMQDSFIRFKARRTNMMQPCKSTYEICKFIDGFLKFYEDKTITFRGATVKILGALNFESLYPHSSFLNHSEPGFHKYDFVKKIVELYIKLKSVHIAKCITTKSHDEVSIRHFYKKLVHEAGQ